jgi:hypothetical protein
MLDLVKMPRHPPISRDEHLEFAGPQVGQRIVPTVDVGAYG